MSKEKIKGFFGKLMMYIVVALLSVGLVLFVVRTLNPNGGMETYKRDKSSLTDVGDDKKAPPVEIKESISDGVSQKDVNHETKEKTPVKKETPVTMILETTQETEETEIPEETPDPVASQEDLGQEATLSPPVPDTSDSNNDVSVTLESQLQDMISSQYTAGGTVAVSAGRISDGVLSLVNDQSMQAASLIKLFVAGCMYETMGDTSQYESLISSMISVSDNTACNSLVSILGGGDAQAGMAVVNTYCMEHGFTETHMGRLMLQPNDQDDNYTSVRDCGNFLLSIYNGSLEGADQILQYMKQQERRGKIPAGVPAGVETANKTGELDFVENDAAIIFHPSGAYVLCVMSEYLSDPYSSRVFMNSLSGTVYCLMG